MSMWPEVLFWYLVVGVVLSVAMTILAYREDQYLRVSDWVRALIFPVVWLPAVVWMMWTDRFGIGEVGRIKRTGVRHDFLKPCWGHALHLQVKDEKKGILTGSLHHFKPVRVGDELEWRTDWGRVIALVTHAKPTGNVWDMYFVTCRAIERIEE